MLMRHPKPESVSTRIGGLQAADNHRWFVGLAVGRRCDRATAAIINVAGRGLDAKVEVAGIRTTDIPRGISSLFDAVCGAMNNGAMLASLRAKLAEVGATLTLDLLAGEGIAPTRVLALGVCDPGIWEMPHPEGKSPTGIGARPAVLRLDFQASGKGSGRNDMTPYLGLCDSARLAETTGLNVIDAFPARDLAVGGLGGPLSALPHWLLLRDPTKNRILLDLGRTTRLSHLPMCRQVHAEEGILAFEVGPGLSLLDQLTQRLTAGQERFDPGGRLAVQGKQLPDLLQFWLSNAYFECPPPRWHPRGVRPERFLADSIQKAVAAGWSVRDMLCTATHFLAEMVAQTLRRRFTEGVSVDELIVTGGGQHNGLLLHEIGSRTGLPVRHLGEFGISSEAMDPAEAGLLAMLHVDQVAANPPQVTGATSPRLLGRLTTGSPRSWRMLIESCVSDEKPSRSMRAAG